MSRWIKQCGVALLAIVLSTTSHAGLFKRLLPKPSTVIGAAAIGAAYYAAKHCKPVRDQETGRSKLVCGAPGVVKSESAE